MAVAMIRPETGIYPPEDEQFATPSGDAEDFREAPELEVLAEVLTQRHRATFGHLLPLTVVYLWKRKGPKKSGHAVYGKCQKPSGLLKHFSHAHFVIWLSADHCRDARFDPRQIEALLFHEMLHAQVDDESLEPTLYPHDFEGFRQEIAVYGAWDEASQEMAETFRQIRLGE